MVKDEEVGCKAGDYHCCKICVMFKGLKGSEMDTCGYAFKTEEELLDHMEIYHGQIIIKKGETEEQARKRVYAKIPGYGTPSCKCGMCEELRKAGKKP